MFIVEIILCLLLIGVGIYATKSDLSYGIIKNKVLLSFSIPVIALDIVYYGFFANDLFGLFGINFIILALVSLILFYTHSLAGGDCKLLLLMGLIYPARLYIIFDNLQITFWLIICIGILLGYFYLLGSSLLSLIQKKNSITKEYIKNYLLGFVKSFLIGLVYVALINQAVQIATVNGVYFNISVIRMISIALMMFIGKVSFFKSIKVVCGVIGVDIIAAIYLNQIPLFFSIYNFGLIVVLMIFQMTISSNLYQTIQVEDLKKGMILSTFMSLMMQGSKIDGIPKVSVEDLRSRLSSDEVEAVKKWAGKNKKESLVVVRKIPFAVFVFLGVICYFTFYYVGVNG